MLGRIRQTLQALTAPLRPVEDDLAAQYLASVTVSFFMTMRRSDRQHHIRVLKYLLANEQNNPALLKAALLHDVGKTKVSITIIDRILAVLGKQFFPQRFDAWGQGEPRGWRKAFVVSVQHPQWGADLFSAVESDQLAHDLILHHQDPVAIVSNDATLRELLVQLQAADDAS